MTKKILNLKEKKNIPISSKKLMMHKILTLRKKKKKKPK